MSDVIVTTTNSVTDVTTTDDVTNINITETVVEVNASTAGVQGVPGVNSDPIYVIVTNKTGVTLSKGSIVYTSGANGTHTQVSLANASSDATSARTLGWVVSDILNNADGLVCVEGYIDGIDTQGITEGAQLYLSGTVSGGFTATKPQAPTHLVYVGVCSKASAGNGRVLVKVQNGYELDELHNVKIVSPQNNDLLHYVSGTALWENVAATAVSVGSATNAGTSVYAQTSGTSVYATNSGTATYATTSGTAVSISGSITRSQVSDFTSGTVASASTAQQAGTAVYATNAGTSVYAETSGTSVYSTNAGTSVYADTSGTATYATTSGTAVSISGTITRSQVSDYASGTVANISGTVTQSQVSNLTTDLAGKAGLADNNTFSGLNTFSNFTTFQAAADAIPIRVFGANGQSADLFSVNDYLTNTQFEILSDGRAQSLKGIIATVSSTASVPLVVRGTAGQSANLMQVETSSATAISVTSAGNLNVVGQARVGTTSGLGQLSVVSTGTATIAAVIRGASGQSTDYFSIQNSGGTALARMNLNGSFFFGTTTANYPTFFGSSGSLAGMINVVPASTAVIPIIVRGAASQSADLLQIQNSSGGTVTRVDSNGAIASGNTILGQITSIPASTATKGLVIRGASGQSANLFEIQNSTPTTLVSVGNDGAITHNAFYQNFNNMLTSGRMAIGTSSLPSGVQLGVYSGGTANKGLVVQGIASQSADLQQWQNSSGGTVARVLADGSVSFSSGNAAISVGGVIRGVNVNTSNDYVSLRQENSGGVARLTKGTAIASNPGTNTASLYFRDGTNAGTLKLVVRAGTAGAETTILDNIPQS